MRRLLKALASNENVGDVSTLEDGTAVEEIKHIFEDLKKSVRKQQ